MHALCSPRRPQAAGGEDALLTALLPRQGAPAEGRDGGSEGASAAWAAELCARAPLLAQMPWHAVQPRSSVLAALAALADAAALRTGAGGAQAPDATAALDTLLGVSGSPYCWVCHLRYGCSQCMQRCRCVTFCPA